MAEYFHALADHAQSALKGGERFTAWYHAEQSDFVRFNQSKVRQAGQVLQQTLNLDLIDGQRHTGLSLGLSGQPESDRARITAGIALLRERLQSLPEDPWLLVNEEPRSSERRLPDRLADAGQVVDEVRGASARRDLVGHYAAGHVQTGFANSLGQRNWDSAASFNLDWSFYHGGDKAAKGSYAGFAWSSGEFAQRARRSAEQLAVLERTPRSIEPGAYRVYLAPGALVEVVDMLRWGGFGVRAHRTKTSPLLRMSEGRACLAPSLHVRENSEDGVAPAFQEQGFPRPPRVELIRGGRFADPLVSPRSAREYGLETNGASGGEMPHSIEIDPGEIPQERVLEELGTGIYVSNLWYLNFSDRSACRTTGMTRFATFWVENGALAAPVPAMRFDETVYRMLGHGLLGLTREREMLLDADTYGRRSTRSARLPGALIEGVAFTL